MNETVEKNESQIHRHFSFANVATGVVLSFAILAVIVFYSGSGATVCKRTLPLALATSLESAINNFFTEYGTLPDTGDHVTTDNAKLLAILLGFEDPSGKIQNLRNVKFLAVKEGKNRRSGLIYNADGKPEGLFDPWGSPYTVELDTDNDEVLRFKLGGKSIKLKGRRVAAWSPGADRKPGTSDDVTTW